MPRVHVTNLFSLQVVATKCVPDLLPTSSILAPYLESEFAERDKPTVVL